MNRSTEDQPSQLSDETPEPPEPEGCFGCGMVAAYLLGLGASVLLSDVVGSHWPAIAFLSVAIGLQLLFGIAIKFQQITGPYYSRIEHPLSYWTMIILQAGMLAVALA